MIDETLPPAELPPEFSPGEMMPEAPQQTEAILLSRAAMLEELLEWCNNFQKAAAAWRKSSWEGKWERWQRNSDSVYDPAIAAKKEEWQSKAYWPLTASHRENAQAQLFRTELGPKPPLDYKPRIERPDPGPNFDPNVPLPEPVDQGALIRDLVLYEREKARYPIARNLQIEDKTTYGSGFMRRRFEERLEPRKVKVPQYEQISLSDPGSVMRAMSGQRQIIGYKDEVQEVITYRGVRLEWISIWDVFPDPKALQIPGNPISVRYSTTLGEIKRGIDLGYYIPECWDKLKDIASKESNPEDKEAVAAERRIAEGNVIRTKYGTKAECYEIEARLPKKWVLINGEDIDDPEALVPAVIRFHPMSVISVAISEAYDGEPMIDKDDYMPVAGQFYGRGVPEMLKDVQMVSTEVINQRLDAGSKALKDVTAVIEKAVFDPKDFEENRSVVRVKPPGGMALTDVKQVIGRLDKATVDRSAFIESAECERMAQERTSITRATLGTAAQVNDSNQTLGGQEIQQGVTEDKMSFLGMLSEFDFVEKSCHGIWALIYQNYNPEDYVMALGEERAAQLTLMSPEQVAQNYRLVPKGIFEAENKQKRDMVLGAMDQQYGMEPWFDRLGVAKARLASAGVDEGSAILPQAQAIQITSKAQMMAQGMAQQMVEQHQQQELAAKAEKGAKMADRGR